ncbi:PrpF domain-containing protein [Salicibibacter kimchii]|uniref:PrpF protein n=1 Tax=Salicibibacter kimchii TaxID=2099786 RepID=A0A345BXM1_9BACI|nr:PrpF domain-containing protein [Salicibibacter kimchii]AXF55702.1 PrpF protein [Salicibibacter kimchii]
MAQYAIPCCIYRGGTSRGLFFHEKDLPANQREKHRVFLEAIDAYNPSQIDGLGSGTSHTSKVVVIAPSKQEDADINYTFYQIGIGQEIVDDKGTCGNLMAAVGAFAVDENLVDPSHKEGMAIQAFNTNIEKMISIQVPVENGVAQVQGAYQMPGTVRPGAKYAVHILDPGGGKTGETLPLGSIYKENDRNYSFVDLVNPFVHLEASTFHLDGTESNAEISENGELLAALETVRAKASVSSGMEETVENARKTPAVPKITLVAPPQTYVSTSGTTINEKDIDVTAKMISMGKVHRTFAGSGLYNLAASILLPGTIPNRLANAKQSGVVRIGHPDGIAEVMVALSDEDDISSVGLDRTARLIMKGEVYIRA